MVSLTAPLDLTLNDLGKSKSLRLEDLYPIKEPRPYITVKH